MKTTGLLLLMMVWAAWTQGTGFAVPSSSANPASSPPADIERTASPRDGRYQTRGKTSDEQRKHGPASGPNHSLSRANLIKASHPKPLPNRGQHSLPGNGMNFHQPTLGKPSGAATGGLIPNQTLGKALPVRMSSVARPIVPSVNNVRHRGPNPAVVGGAPNIYSSNTGAINGTRVNRKP